MYTHYIFSIILVFNLVRGEEDVEVVLAQTNLQGYPSALLFDSVSANQNEASALDKSKVAKLLESKEVQAAVTKAALQYSAQMMNQSGQARNLLSDAGLCEYSWVSWLPWMDCEPYRANSPTTSLPLISESSYSCY